MVDSFIIAHIKSLPTFAHLNAEQTERVAEVVRVQQFAVGDLVFQQGQPARGMVKLISGEARLWQLNIQNQQQLVGTIVANQYLNEAALARPSSEGATLQIIKPSVVMLIEREPLLAILATRSDILSAIPLDIQGIPAPVNPTSPQSQNSPISRSPSAMGGLPQQRKQRPASINTPSPNNPVMPNTRTEPQQAPKDDIPIAKPKEKKVFRNQRDNENLLIDTRRHWWAFMRKVWLPTLIVSIIFGLSALIPANIALPLDGFAFVLFASMMMYFYLEWQNDHLIVTTQRILHIERVILTFQQRISEVPFASIQEINADEFTQDPFSRLFRFGKVEIKTPGDSGNIVFNVVPAPLAIQKTIFTHRNRTQEQQEQRHEDEVRAVIDRVVTGDESHMPTVKDDAKPQPQEKRSLLGWQRTVNEDGEVIYRKHWLFWLWHTFVPGFAVLGSFLFIIASLFLAPLQALGILGPILGVVLLIISGLWLYWADWDWRNDMYIINDETIQLIHKRPLWLQSETDQVFLIRIDNVVSDKSGIFQTLFDYGDVRLALVGADKGDAKVFKYVPNPQNVQAEITQRQERIRTKQQKQEEIQRKEEIAEYLRMYHETTGGGGGNIGPNFTQDSYQTTSPKRGNMRPPNIPRT